MLDLLAGLGLRRPIFGGRGKKVLAMLVDDEGNALVDSEGNALVARVKQKEAA